MHAVWLSFSSHFPPPPPSPLTSLPPSPPPPSPPHPPPSPPHPSQADWVYSLSGDSASDLTGYADLFARNHITGRRLFLLTGDDLLQIGMLSVGHRREMLVRGKGRLCVQLRRERGSG